MIYSKSDAIKVIDKLIELTQHGSLVWQESNLRPALEGPDSIIEVVYVATYLDAMLRIYKRNYKYYFDENQFTWDSEIVVEFIAQNGYGLGRLPKTSNAAELLQSIQYQNPQIRNFIRGILG